MSTQHALLGLLGLGELHGYELRRQLEELDPTWRIEFGQLYRLLSGLEQRGLVSSQPVPGQRGPQRKLYRLTAAGREALEGWLADPDAEVRGGRDEFHLKLKLSRALGATGVASLLSARRQALEAERGAALAERSAAQGAGDADRWLLAETRLRKLEGALTALGAYEALRAAPPAELRLQTIIAAGSDDPLLEVLARRIAREHPGRSLTTKPVGSLSGLIALKEGRAHVAGTHLLDVETGEYNVPFVKRLLFEEPVLLVNLAFREQGLMVAPGNPNELKGVSDLARPGLRLINRQPGAGTRLLLRHRLKAEGLSPGALDGYEREAPTHEAVAAAVSLGEADVGMGIRAVAESWGLGFIPVGRERYDLAIPRSLYDSQLLAPLREALGQEGFRREAGERSGYDLSRTGEVLAEVS